MPKQSEIKQDRIEEAAKLSYQYAFLVDDKDIDRRWAKEESKDRWYELARQLFPQPLDKELREWGARWLAAVIENGEPYDDLNDIKWEDYADDYHDAMLELFDQVCAKFQPKIEEAIKQEKIEAFARLCNMPEAEGYDWVMSKEALGWQYMMRTNAECQRIIWQALEGSN